MKVVYVPQHLYAALKKSNLQAQDYQNVEKLLGTLSSDDVAFYLFANDPKNCPIPKPITDTLPNLISEGTDWQSRYGAAPQSDITAKALGKFKSMMVNGCSIPMFEKDAEFTSDCMEENLIIITHVAPAGDNSNRNVKSKLMSFYDRVIRQLLVFQPIETVMGSPILIGWMKSAQAEAKSPVA